MVKKQSASTLYLKFVQTEAERRKREAGVK